MHLHRQEIDMTHIAIIEPTILGLRGQYYRVRYQGEILVQHSLVPEYDA
jgi:hypothetical protein